MSGDSNQAETAQAPTGEPVRNRHALPKLLKALRVIGWVAVALLAIALILEIVFRISGYRSRFLGRQMLQPYLFNGARCESREAMLAAEGPKRFGYRTGYGPTIRYLPVAPVKSMAERLPWLRQPSAGQRPKGAALVALLGAGAARGDGATGPDAAYWKLLSSMASEAPGRAVACIPWASDMMNSTQERVALELVVIPRKPDAVIAFDFFNECLPGIYGNRPGDPHNYPIRWATAHTNGGAVNSLLVRHSAFGAWLWDHRFRAGIDKWRKMMDSDPERYKRLVVSVVNIYMDNASRMKKMCGYKVIAFAVAVQPARAVTLRNRAQPAQDFQSRFVCDCYDALHARVQGTPESEYIHFLDGIFDQTKEDVFAGEALLNDAGQRRVAEAMLPVVAELLRSKQQR